MFRLLSLRAACLGLPFPSQDFHLPVPVDLGIEPVGVLHRPNLLADDVVGRVFGQSLASLANHGSPVAVGVGADAPGEGLDCG